jgi:hypothetical protein
MGVARLLSNLRVLDVLLVDLSLVVVAGLLDLVAEGVLGGGDTSANGGLSVLGNLLVDLLAGARSGSLDGLRDVVGGLLDRLHCEGLFGLFVVIWLWVVDCIECVDDGERVVVEVGGWPTYIHNCRYDRKDATIPENHLNCRYVQA